MRPPFTLSPIRWAMVLAVSWTMLVAASLVWTLHVQRWATNEMARAQARAGFDRDVLFRRWNARHGGLYAAVTEATPPNPYLDVPERDITTPSGTRLTLINPAYMTRQVHEMGAETNGIQGHITSLNPIRPDNAPDPWERTALESFQQGEAECSSIELFRGTPHLRLMRPLRTEKSCLKCHGHQGYKEGDVRGGISISVPMAPLRAIERPAMASAVGWHTATWLLVLLGIGISSRIAARRARQFAAKESQARESEQRFLDVLHASDDAILLIDGETFVDCNDATVRMLGYGSRDEFLMKHPSELSPPTQPDGRDSFEKAQEMMQIAVEKGSHRFEWIHRRADGQDFPVEVTLTAITYHGKGILHCHWRDVTEQKRAEQEREQSRKTMQQILESMPVGVVIIGRDKIVRQVNSAAIAMMGYDNADEIVGHECHRMLCPAQRCSCPILDLDLKVDNTERVLIGKDGKHIPVLKTVIPVTLNGEDVLLETFVDITERKAAEAELRKLSSAIEQNPASVVITDCDGRIEYVNPGFTQTTGYTAEEVIGQNPRILHSGVHPPEFYAQMWETLKRGEVWRGEICNRAKNGELYWEDATIAPVLDESGRVTNYVAVKMDISQRKHAEEQLKAAKEEAESANRAKSQFLASMSHELRTPLTGILGFTDLLLGSDVDEKERRNYLETIRASGQHLLRLINDILDLSKIEASQLEVERAPCAPHRILSDVVSIARAQAQAKSLDLRCRWNGSVPAVIYTDGNRLRQILLNLIGNAVKFTREGGVEIVACLDTSREINKLRVEITDSGIGIPEEKLNSIFDPFVQADSSVTREFGGTGLGLAISIRLARALGGDIEVSSEVGVGSTFILTVDAGDLKGVEMLSSPPADGLQAGREESPLFDNLRFRPGKVLLVEDGHINRKLIATVLEQAGLTVATAENGQLGIDLATKSDFDLILMDMQMPVLDGYAATKRLREQGNTTPIIALTAHAMKGDEERCLAAGCTYYVSKPIAIDTLLATVAKALGRNDSTTNDLNSVSPPEFCDRELVSSLPTDEPVFREIVLDFVEYISRLLAEMRKAAADGRFGQLAEMAHSLKGAAGTAGFDAFTEPARRLEMLAKQQRPDDISPTIDFLEELAQKIVVPDELCDAAS